MGLKLSNSVRTENMILSVSVHFQNISIVAYVNNHFKNNYDNNNRPTNEKQVLLIILFFTNINANYNALNTWDFYFK